MTALMGKKGAFVPLLAHFPSYPILFSLYYKCTYKSILNSHDNYIDTEKQTTLIWRGKMCNIYGMESHRWSYRSIVISDIEI